MSLGLGIYSCQGFLCLETLGLQLNTKDGTVDPTTTEGMRAASNLQPCKTQALQSLKPQAALSLQRHPIPEALKDSSTLNPAQSPGSHAFGSPWPF